MKKFIFYTRLYTDTVSSQKMSYPCLIPDEVIDDAERKILALEAEICAIREHILNLKADSLSVDSLSDDSLSGDSLSVDSLSVDDDGFSICDWESTCNELAVKVEYLTMLITDHDTRKLNVDLVKLEREEARVKRTLV